MNVSINPGFDQIIAYENGELSDEESIALFQQLIDSDMAWSLQGSYGRTARALLTAGHCEATTDIAKAILRQLQIQR
jgi:hypothetical protein